MIYRKKGATFMAKKNGQKGLVFKPCKPAIMPFTPDPRRIAALSLHADCIRSETIRAESFDGLVKKVVDVCIKKS